MSFVEGFSLLFESVTVTIDSEVVTMLDVEAAAEGTEDVEDVTGDGVSDELDCPWTGVGVGVEIAVDEDGGELEGAETEGKKNGIEVEVNVVTGMETVVCQCSS